MMGRILTNMPNPSQIMEVLRYHVQIPYYEIPQQDINHLIRDMLTRLSEVGQLKF